MLLAILSGITGVFIWRRHVRIPELLILSAWGFLLASSPAGHYPSVWLASLSAYVAHVL